MDSLLAGGPIGIRPALGDAMGGAASTLSIRRTDSAVDEVGGRSSPSFDLMRSAAPWRTFRWYKGQRHYNPDYFLSTERGPVVVGVQPRCRLSAPEAASTLE